MKRKRDFNFKDTPVKRKLYFKEAPFERQKKEGLTIQDFFEANSLYNFKVMELFLQDKPDQDPIFMQLFEYYEKAGGRNCLGFESEADINQLFHRLYVHDFFKDKTLDTLLTYHPKFELVSVLAFFFLTENNQNHLFISALINHPKMDCIKLLELIQTKKRFISPGLVRFINNGADLSGISNAIANNPQALKDLYKYLASETDLDVKKALFHMLPNACRYRFFRKTDTLLPEMWNMIRQNLIDLDLDLIKKGMQP